MESVAPAPPAPPHDPNAAIEDLAADFALLGDWEERFAHVIDLGRALPPLAAEERNDATRVRGCASQVWLVTEIRDGRLFFRGESDSHLVRGLIAVLLQVYSGASPAAVLAIDPNELLARLGFAGQLTSQRSNGLAAMLTRIRADAAAAKGA